MTLRLPPPALLAAAALVSLAAAPAARAAASHEAAAPAAAAFDPGRPNPAAPEQTAQFGRLAGIWDVDMKIRQDDGSWPEKGFPAEWRFHYVLDGWAVQDDWFAPPPGRPVEEGQRRQLGTGLRIYRPDEGRWDVAWISNTQQQLSTFEARAEGSDGMVMTGLHPTGKPSRTTFIDITGDSFDWRLELQGLGEDPDAWTEVARLHAERRR